MGRQQQCRCKWWRCSAGYGCEAVREAGQGAGGYEDGGECARFGYGRVGMARGIDGWTDGWTDRWMEGRGGEGGIRVYLAIYRQPQAIGRVVQHDLRHLQSLSHGSRLAIACPAHHGRSSAGRRCPRKGWWEAPCKTPARSECTTMQAARGVNEVFAHRSVAPCSIHTLCPRD